MKLIRCEMKTSKNQLVALQMKSCFAHYTIMNICLRTGVVGRHQEKHSLMGECRLPHSPSKNGEAIVMCNKSG